MSKPPSLLDIEDILCDNADIQERPANLKRHLSHFIERHAELGKTFKDLTTAINRQTGGHDPLLENDVFTVEWTKANANTLEIRNIQSLQKQEEKAQPEAKKVLIPSINQAIQTAADEQQAPGIILGISIVELLEVFLSFFWDKEAKQAKPRDDTRTKNLQLVLTKQIKLLTGILQLEIKTTESHIPASPSAAKLLSSQSVLTSPKSSGNLRQDFSADYIPLSPSDALVAGRTGFVSTSKRKPSPPLASSQTSADNKGVGSDLLMILTKARLQRTRAKIALYVAADRLVPEDLVLAEQQYDFKKQLEECRARDQFAESKALEPLPELLENFRRIKSEFKDQSLSPQQQQRLATAEFKVLSAHSALSGMRYQRQLKVIEDIESIVPSFLGVSEAKKTADLSAAIATRNQLGQEKTALERRLVLFRRNILQSQQENILSCEALSCEIASLQKLLSESAEPEQKKQEWKKDLDSKRGQKVALQKRIADALLIKNLSDNPCNRDNARIEANPPEQSRMKYLSESLQRNRSATFRQVKDAESSINQLRRQLAKLCLRLVSGALLQMAQRNLTLTQAKPKEFKNFPKDFNNFVDWFTVAALIPNFNQTLQPLFQQLQDFSGRSLSQLVEKSDGLTSLLQTEAKALEKSLSQSCKDCENALAELLGNLQNQEAFLKKLTKTMRDACQQQEQVVVRQEDSEAKADLSVEFKSRVTAYEAQLNDLSKQAVSGGDAKSNEQKADNKTHTVTEELKFFIEQGVYSVARLQAPASGASSVSSAPPSVVQAFSRFCQELLDSGKPKRLPLLLAVMDEEKLALGAVLNLPIVENLPKQHFKAYHQFFLDDIDGVIREALDLAIETQFMQGLKTLADFFPKLRKELGLDEKPLVVENCKKKILSFSKDLQRTEEKAGESELKKPLQHRTTVYSKKLLTNLQRVLTKPTPEEKEMGHSELILQRLFSDLLKIKLTELLVTLIESRRRTLGEGPSEKTPEAFEKLLSDYRLTQITESHLNRCVKRLHALITGPKVLDVNGVQAFCNRYLRTEQDLEKQQLEFNQKLERRCAFRLYCEAYYKGEGVSNGAEDKISAKTAKFLLEYVAFRQHLAKQSESSTIWLRYSAQLIRGDIRLQLADEIAKQSKEAQKAQEQARQKLAASGPEQQQIIISKLTKPAIPYSLSDSKSPLVNLLSFCSLSQRYVAAQKLQNITKQWREIKLDSENITQIKAQGYLPIFISDEKALPPGWRQGKDKKIYIFWNTNSQNFRFNYVINWYGQPEVRVFSATDPAVNRMHSSISLQKEAKILSGSDLEYIKNIIVGHENTFKHKDMTQALAHLSEEEQFQYSMLLLRQAEEKLKKPLQEVAVLLTKPPQISALQVSAGDSELKAFRPLLTGISSAETRLADTFLGEAAAEFQSTFYPIFDSYDKLHSLFCKYRKLCTEEQLLVDLIKQPQPAVISRFGIETYKKWIEPVIELAASFFQAAEQGSRETKAATKEVPPLQTAQALARLLQGMVDGEVGLCLSSEVEAERKQISASLSSNRTYAPVVTLLFPNLGIKEPIPDAPRGLEKLKDFAKTKWVERLAAIENLHSLLKELNETTKANFSLRLVRNEVELHQVLTEIKPLPTLFKCANNGKPSFYIYGHQDKVWGLTQFTYPVTQLPLAELVFPQNSWSSNTIQKIPHPVMVEIREKKANVTVADDLLERLEKLHTDLITVWRRRMVESPMEKAHEREELQILLEGSTLSLLEDVLGPDGMDRLDSMGVLDPELYETIDLQISTLSSWKFEEDYRASYQALFYDFLCKSEYDVDLVEYDLIYTSAKNKEWLHRVDLAKLANTEEAKEDFAKTKEELEKTKATLERAKQNNKNSLDLASTNAKLAEIKKIEADQALRKEVANSIAPYDLNEFLEKKRFRLQIAELLTLLGMLRTEQAGMLEWLHEVDFDKLEPSTEPQLAVNHPEEWFTYAEAKNIHNKTQFYIVNPKLLYLRDDPAAFNKELRAKIAGIGLLEAEVIGWFRTTIQPAYSLAWLDEIDQSLLESKTHYALKNLATASQSKLFHFFPDLAGLLKDTKTMSMPSLFNLALKEKLKKAGLSDIKKTNSSSTRSDTSTTKKDLTDLSKMISALQALVKLPPQNQARMIKELISKENPLLLNFIRWLQEIVNRSDSYKLNQQLVAVRHKKQDILVRFKNSTGSEIKSEEQRSVIKAFRDLEKSIQKSAEGFRAVLSGQEFSTTVEEEKPKQLESKTESKTEAPSSTPMPVGTPPKINGTPKPNAKGNPVPSTPVARTLSQALQESSALARVKSIDSAVLAIAETRKDLRRTMTSFQQESPEDTKDTESKSSAVIQSQGLTPAQLCMELVNKLQDHQEKRGQLLEEISELSKESTDPHQDIENKPSQNKVQRITIEIETIRAGVGAQDNILTSLIRDYEAKQSESNKAVKATTDLPGKAGPSRQEVESKLQQATAELAELDPHAKAEQAGLEQQIRELGLMLRDSFSAPQQGPAVADYERELKSQREAIARQAGIRIELAQDQKHLREFLGGFGHGDTFQELQTMVTLPANVVPIAATESVDARREKRLNRIEAELRAELSNRQGKKNERLNALYELEVWVLTPVIRAAVEDLEAKTAAIEQNFNSEEAKQWMMQSRRLIDWLKAPQIPKAFEAKSVPVIAGPIMNPVPEIVLDTIKNPDVQERYKKLMQEQQRLLALQAGLIESVAKLQEFIRADPETRRIKNLTAQSPLEINLEFEKLCFKCKLWNRKASIIMGQVVSGYVFSSKEYERVLKEQKADNETKLPQTLESKVVASGVDLPTLTNEDKEIKAKYLSLVQRYDALQRFVAAREQEWGQLEKNQLPPPVNLPQTMPDKESDLLGEFSRLLSKRGAWRASLVPPDLRQSQNGQRLVGGADGRAAAVEAGETLTLYGDLSFSTRDSHF